MDIFADTDIVDRICVQCRKEKIYFGRFMRCSACRRVNQVKRKEADARRARRRALVETQVQTYTVNSLAYSLESDPDSDDVPAIKHEPQPKPKLLTELRGTERREAERMIEKALQPAVAKVVRANIGTLPHFKVGFVVFLLLCLTELGGF